MYNNSAYMLVYIAKLQWRILNVGQGSFTEGQGNRKLKFFRNPFRTFLALIAAQFVFNFDTLSVITRSLAMLNKLNRNFKIAYSLLPSTGI